MLPDIESKYNDPDEYIPIPINEDSYEIMMECKSLLRDSKIDSIRIILKEIVDLKSIKRQIYINGIISPQNKLNYKSFYNTFLDYISDLDSFLSLPNLFGNNLKNTYDRIYYIDPSKTNNLVNIKGDIIELEELLNKEEVKDKLKLLIFWKNADDIEKDMDIYLNLAKTYNKCIHLIFISTNEDFVEKKLYLNEKKFYRENENSKTAFYNNVEYIFDDKYLFNKYFVIKFPWFTLLDKNNNIYDSGFLRKDEIKNIIDNFLGNNPESGKNIDNLYWVDIGNKIKINLIKEINLLLSEKDYNDVFFYVEMNISIALQDYNTVIDIDGYFTGDLNGKDIKEFKRIAQNICDSKKIKNIHFNLD